MFSPINITIVPPDPPDEPEQSPHAAGLPAPDARLQSPQEDNASLASGLQRLHHPVSYNSTSKTVVMNMTAQMNDDAAQRTSVHRPHKQVPAYQGELPVSFHAAVRSKDSAGIQALIALGKRPHKIEAGMSPLDLLDSLQDFDKSTRQDLRSALLASQNPSAPPGYVKPEAFHGSPWGLEILLSGALKGGVTPRKGGTKSLEGKVFFSDRTPERKSDSHIRDNVRASARTHARGGSTALAAPGNRGIQYQVLQKLIASAGGQGQLNLTGNKVEVRTDAEHDNEAKLYQYLRGRLESAFIIHERVLLSVKSDIHEEIALPRSIVLYDLAGEDTTLSGQALNDLYAKIFSQIKEEFEARDMPLLSAINNGDPVPLVFGFDKVYNLKPHSMARTFSESKQFFYQDEDHPLAGNDNGGKLKEIEVKSLADLATLSIGLMAKGGQLQDQWTIRMNSSNKLEKSRGTGEPAQYFTMTQVKAFQDDLAQTIAEQQGIEKEAVPAYMAQASIEELQTLNTHLRSLALSMPEHAET